MADAVKTPIYKRWWFSFPAVPLLPLSQPTRGLSSPGRSDTASYCVVCCNRRWRELARQLNKEKTTQAEIGRMLGVAQKTVSMWLSKKEKSAF